MTFDLGAAVLRHDPNDQAADYRNRYYPPAEMIVARTKECGAEVSIKSDVREQSNQLVKQECDTSSDEAYTAR